MCAHHIEHIQKTVDDAVRKSRQGSFVHFRCPLIYEELILKEFEKSGPTWCLPRLTDNRYERLRLLKWLILLNRARLYLINLQDEMPVTVLCFAPFEFAKKLYKLTDNMKNIVFVDFYDSLDKAREELVFLVNEARERNGLRTLRVQEQLMMAATDHCRYLSTRRDWTHIGKDGSSPQTRAIQAGYRYSAVSENTAVGAAEASVVCAAWMNSRSHRKNILNANYIHYGIAAIRLNKDFLPTIVLLLGGGSNMSKTLIFKRATTAALKKMIGMFG